MGLATISGYWGDLLGPDGRVLTFETPRVWTALFTRPLREQDAADWLKERHLFAYWPCYRTQVSSGNGTGLGNRARHVRFTSVITGYLFMAARADCPVSLWQVIDQAPGILGYLRDGSGAPATLTNDDIEIIRNIEAGLNLPPRSIEHRYKTGDKVRFTDDLKGQWKPGKVKALAKDGRIAIEVPLLGRVVLVWASAHQIEMM